MKRSFVRGLARCLASVLFLAQMTIAAYACPGLSSSIAAGAPMGQMQPMAQTSAAAAPQVEVSSDPGAAAMAAQMPDCSDMAGPMDPGAANLCAEHCKYGQQSDQTPTLVLPFALLMVLYTTDPAPVATLPGSTAAQEARLAPPPGHTVLHCVYRL